MNQHEKKYLATVAELQAISKNAPHVTQDWILQVASMDVDDMRRRLIRNYDWHASFSHVLDGLKEIRCLPGSAPDGCWEPRSIRGIVDQLVSASPVTWENSYSGTPKSKGSAEVLLTHDLPPSILAMAKKFHFQIEDGEILYSEDQGDPQFATVCVDRWLTPKYGDIYMEVRIVQRASCHDEWEGVESVKSLPLSEAQALQLINHWGITSQESTRLAHITAKQDHERSDAFGPRPPKPWEEATLEASPETPRG